jgi:hypothetical protein
VVGGCRGETHKELAAGEEEAAYLLRC